MENLDKIKQEKIFCVMTKKDIEYIKFLQTRISPFITSNVAKEMIDFALSKKQSLKILKKIENDIFINKIPSDNPTVHIVISQAGGGKTVLSKKILQDYKNTVHIDSDKYKKYNPLSDLIIKNSPTYFGHLTGIDAYLHRDYIYDKAIKNHYNILIEVTPSTKEGLFNINLEKLNKEGYNVMAHILAVSKINSLLSIHERYENQLSQNLPDAKLTDLTRAIDSYYAVESILDQIRKFDFIDIKIYKRLDGTVELTSNCKQASLEDLQRVRVDDFTRTLKNLNYRIAKINSQLNSRNAPDKQFLQFKKIEEIIEFDKNTYNE